MGALTSLFTFFHKPILGRDKVFHKKMWKVFKTIYPL